MTAINISKIRKPDLRRSLGVVLQECKSVYPETTLWIISAYGRLDATDEELYRGSQADQCS